MCQTLLNELAQLFRGQAFGRGRNEVGPGRQGNLGRGLGLSADAAHLIAVEALIANYLSACESTNQFAGDAGYGSADRTGSAAQFNIPLAVSRKPRNDLSHQPVQSCDQNKLNSQTKGE